MKRHAVTSHNGSKHRYDPVQFLKKEHEEVRELFDRYLNSDDMQIRREAGLAVLTLLEMHSAMEEAAFYPAVRDADAQLIEHCEAEHEQADQLVRQLKTMDPEDWLYESTFRQLHEAIMQHIDSEEKQLFPELGQSKIDMEQLGLEIQAFESTMIGLHPGSARAKSAARTRA